MEKLLLILYSVLVFSTRIDYRGDECEIFLRKFSTKQINFDGESVQLNSTSVQINLKYWDEMYFDDPKYFGLVQEDGKSPESTSLDLKLVKFSNGSYTDPVQVFDLKITPFEDSKKKIRYYSFLMKQQELETRMIKTENTNYYLYKGYYAIEYYYAETDQL